MFSKHEDEPPASKHVEDGCTPAHRSTHLTQFNLFDYGTHSYYSAKHNNKAISLITIETCTTATICVLYSLLYRTYCDLMMAQKAAETCSHHIRNKLENQIVVF